jgi:cellulose synthase/poly-beta-1,6-N-acetylglucosamine synthase-like glycosyltransferase
MMDRWLKFVTDLGGSYLANVFAVLAIVCLLAALHPFITYPLSLWLLSRLRPRPLTPELPAGTALEPDLAILMCAYNEEHVIESKAENLLKLKAAYPNIDLLIYVDAASDRTAELLEPYSDQIRVVVSAERTGKTPGMNLLMSMVDKPIILFTDANVMIDLDAPQRLMRYFADPGVGCVAGHLRYTNSDASVTAGSGSLYWRLEEWIKRRESEIGSCMGADGSLFAIRRSLHTPPPAELCDDMYVSLNVLCQGARVVQADDVTAYEESVTSASEEFSRKARIACQSFNAHQQLWPSLRRCSPLVIYQYLSHKWLRWFAIAWVAGAAIFGELALIAHQELLLAWLAPLVGSVLLLIGYLGWEKRLSQVWDILTAFAGTGLGVLQSMRGRSYRTWTPAASIRK